MAKLDRIGRNTGHLIELADAFAARGADFVSLGDSIDTGTATGRREPSGTSATQLEDGMK